MATAAENVDSEPVPAGRAAGPCVIVLFGASGDLTMRKLVPALYNLVKAKLLPANFAVMGVAHDDLSVEQFRTQVTRFLQKEDHASESWKWFTERLFYQKGDFADPAAYATLSGRLAEIDTTFGTAGNYLYYLAVAPRFFAEVVQQLGRRGWRIRRMDAGGGWSLKSPSETISIPPRR